MSCRGRVKWNFSFFVCYCQVEEENIFFKPFFFEGMWTQIYFALGNGKVTIPMIKAYENNNFLNRKVVNLRKCIYREK